ncbi:MAG TPA: hypothetical protein VF834_08525, partial [Streptosporangiaceae bacterium]
GLDPAADLTDDDVRAAWRRIAAATHPDRADGGDPARFAAAASAYTDLRTAYGRGEARASLSRDQRGTGGAVPARRAVRSGRTPKRRRAARLRRSRPSWPAGQASCQGRCRSRRRCRGPSGVRSRTGRSSAGHGRPDLVPAHRSRRSRAAA